MRIPILTRAINLIVSKLKNNFNHKAKLDEWEHFYKFHKPNGAHNRKIPYGALREESYYK
jgi:hypothetical protein